MLAVLLPFRTTQDYGETLVPHKNPGGIKGSSTVLKAHPTRHDWVLARAKRPGCRLLDEVEMRCANDLLVAEVCGNEGVLRRPTCTTCLVGLQACHKRSQRVAAGPPLVDTDTVTGQLR